MHTKQHEHEQQLRQNDLDQVAQKSLMWIEQYRMQLLVGIGGTLAVIIIAAIWWSSASVAQSAAWGKLSTATTVDDYGSIADAYPGTLAAAWANLRMGELNLETGINNLFKERSLGESDLKAARADLEKVIDSNAKLPDNVRARALLGLATCLEALCDGDTEPVIAAYQRVLKEYPDSIYKPQVEARIKELQTSGAREFYAWFHAQNGKSPGFARPQDGKKSSLPDGNPFEFPPRPAPATSSDPAAAEKTPADKPTADKPSSDKVSDDSAAADNASTQKTPAEPAAESKAPAEPASPKQPE